MSLQTTREGATHRPARRYRWRMDRHDRYEVFLRVADEDDERVYLIEHWFADRPETETVAALFEEAKRDFAVLYPDADAEDFSVELRRLRADETQRPQEQVERR
jgi:hypothetical protein